MNGERPKMQLVRRESDAAFGGRPTGGGVSATGGAAPTWQPTSAPASVASAMGAEPVRESFGGRTSVSFPPPGGGGTVSSPGGSNSLATLGANASAAPAGQTPPPSLDDQFDEIYERVVERLRRDMLVERERMGDLVGDILR